MSFRDYPDPAVPPSDLRCEAMTKPHNGWPDWSRPAHRCIRLAKQSRAGRSVCNLHAHMKKIEYWDGSPDPFPTPRNKEHTT